MKIYPKFPIVSVGAVVIKDAKVLLIKRRNEPHKGEWSIPGGVVELGESLSKALEREILEECNIKVKAREILGITEKIEKDEKGRIKFHYVIIDMNAEYLDGTAKPISDAEEIRWVPFENIEKMKIREKLKEIIGKAMK